jgi:hypothetical protein
MNLLKKAYLTVPALVILASSSADSALPLSPTPDIPQTECISPRDLEKRIAQQNIDMCTRVCVEGTLTGIGYTPPSHYASVTGKKGNSATVLISPAQSKALQGRYNQKFEFKGVIVPSPYTSKEKHVLRIYAVQQDPCAHTS